MTTTDSGPLVFIAAGEASGDLLGARLMHALKEETSGKVRFAGIGGERMQAEGLKSLFPMEELSVMGIIEILPHAKRILGRISQAARAVGQLKPDVVITIDSPGFSKRFVDRIEDRSIPRVHYVAPTVWAWRPGRVHKFKNRFDLLLTLLPFEPPYFERVGLKAAFVGHSVIESGIDRADGLAFRKSRGISDTAVLLSVLPGSRKGEVDKHLPVFGHAVSLLSERVEGLEVVLPTLPHLAGMISEKVRDWPVKVHVVTDFDQRFPAMAASNAAVAASGTVALELALARVPTVVAYKLAPLTHWIVRRLVKVDYVHILNIMAGREIVPERIQQFCTAENLANDVIKLLGDDGGRQIDQLVPLLGQLGQGDDVVPSLRAARAVLDFMASRHKSR